MAPLPSPLRGQTAAWAGTFLALLALISGAAAEGWPMVLPTDPAPLVAHTNNGEQRFSIEVADDPEKRQRGLMFRRSMGDDHGMLFVFPESGRRSFWMKDTPMALDLLFIADGGTVRAIAPGEPFSTKPISPDVQARFVLELKAGTAQKAGIEVGDRLSHPTIDGGTADKFVK